MHFHPARPQHRIPVPLKSGLTNFSDSADPATSLALKEKFSAGIFCFFMGFYAFNGIQASYAGLFDAKKKESFGGGEPRQE
ncbi:hypothetical protein SRABI27_04096 [Pedobacter sp. Bi27]|uniref:hypothetical protein n=1 Tax=unclassified Pedobacter TaxID=2628915 RepID=UPI001D8F5542|nr:MULTISPECIES: hypothetical protein [unclassified Pedobacter]CAH0261807.1 hypothetical protein SRABI36_03488 [Pedobacter sp. Bi36]CAH0288551.1 hypothetical protein SRABI126_03982 [Pedobacter sp. Bi126]CAH0291971.1 hypothetical protein SRABI27_04096 [Pedobacter sp. Bi27]